MQANLFAEVPFVPFDFPKCFYSSTVKTLEALYLPARLWASPRLSPSFPPSLPLGSLPSEAFDWKHALFNHWGDSPCPVFAPLPCCNNKGRVTLSVSSGRDVWRRERGQRKKERKKWRGSEEGVKGKGEEKLRDILWVCQPLIESYTRQQKRRNWFKVKRIQGVEKKLT